MFAFLPLRSYGLRFIVQGDFDLPSSREDVNSDSVWNQFIRDEIPQLFLSALDKIKVYMFPEFAAKNKSPQTSLRHDFYSLLT